MGLAGNTILFCGSLFVMSVADFRREFNRQKAQCTKNIGYK